MIQRDALNLLKTGRNVFVTGPAGSGKTFVVNEYITYLKEHEVPIGITASTGIAATHMGGMTIHAWSGISIKDRLSLEDLSEIAERASVKKKIEAAQVLIIDEVSMLHHFRLDMVDQVLRHIKKKDVSFGGIQVVLCGDFFQLPPVSRLGEPQAQFIYESEAWKEGSFAICYLSENHRQINDPSLSILNEIRGGEVSEQSYELLMSRLVTPAEKSEILSADRTKSGTNSKYQMRSEEPVATRLYTHNIDVDAVNERELARVASPEIIYEMDTRGRKPLVETLKKSCLAPEKLRLRKGARVICVKNNFEKGYVNGTLGVVVSCAFGSDPIIRTAGTPDHPEGQLIAIERATWQIDDDGKILAEISQYPLRLAWAITVHKSQGMSLDAVEVDLSKSFEPGMGYVALSRVRTLDGLRILGINNAALQVHPEVLEFDRHLQERSLKAERYLESADESDIVRQQHEFLTRVAPLYKSGSQKSGARSKENPKKLSTFEKTAQLIHRQKSLKDIAREREVTVETVIAQIERLIEGGNGTGEGLTKSDVAYLKDEISHSHFSRLEKAFEEVSLKMNDDMPPLSPVKSKVGANISWNEIRLARVLLGYIKRK